MGIVGKAGHQLEPVVNRAGALTAKIAATAGAVTIAALMGSTSVFAQCAGGANSGVEFLLPVSSSTVAGLVSAINTVNTSFLTSSSAFVSSPGDASANQMGAGVWARAIGGTVESKATTTQSYDLSAIGGVDNGILTCNNRVKMDFKGYQFGHDIGVLKGPGGFDLHVGATAGFFEGRAKDTTRLSGQDNFYDQFSGALAAKFQVPFAGIYAALRQGNLTADAQVRYDSYRNTLSSVADGLFAQDINAHGLSLTANASYAIPLGQSNWTLTPGVGIIVSKVKVDTLDVAGTWVLDGSISQNSSQPGFLKVNDIQSTLARASLTISTTASSPTIDFQPFFTASLLHEYGGAVTSSVTIHDADPSFFGGIDGVKANLTTSRVGTYAQFGLGMSAAFTNTGWLGYVRGDYKTGENINGVSVNTGLRYQYDAKTTGSANTTPIGASGTNDGVHDWTGLYAGVSGGAARGTQNWVFNGNGAMSSPGYQGAMITLQGGYNFQFDQIVLGLEGDLSGLNAKGAVSCPNALFFSCNAGISRLSTLTSRLGYATGNTLFYAKAGLASGLVSAGGTENTGGNPLNPCVYDPTCSGSFFLIPTLTSSHIQTGWTAGGGVEFALAKDWSAKAEYMHYDLGRAQFLVEQGNVIANAKTTGDTVRVGVNYHLGNLFGQ